MDIPNTVIMSTAVSADHTPIAYRSGGSGPPLVAVHGTTADHTTWRLVGPLLEPHHTVHALDRRGRGRSGDGPSYALEREFEDVAAVVRAVAEATGEPVSLVGHSHGGLCVLGGARLAGDAVRRLVLYEPPLGPDLAPGAVAALEALLAQDRREEALTTFLREAAAVPEHELELLRGMATWPVRVAAAPTIPREERAVAGFQPDPDWFAAVTAPTLLLLGGDSPPRFARPTERIRAALPDARVEVLPGQQHVATHTAPELVATAVLRFLSEGSARSEGGVRG